MSDTITRRLPILALCIASALTLTACGGGGKKSPTDMRVMPAEDIYGSLASGDRGGASFGYGDSRASARSRAVTRCGNLAEGTNCREVLWFRNACGALARSADDRQDGVAWGTSRNDAHTKAIAACHAAGGQTCRVATSSEGSPLSVCYTGGSSPAAGGVSSIPRRSAGTPTPTPTPTPTGNYLAVAHGESDTTRAYAWQFGTGTNASAAERNALTRCQNFLGLSCRLRLRGNTNICHAVAVSECPSADTCRTPAFGFSSHRTSRASAEREAIELCEIAASGSYVQGTCRIATGRGGEPGVSCVGTAAQ